MKNFITFLILCLLTLISFGQASIDSDLPRKTILFNNDWKFYLGHDHNFKNINIDDSKWRDVGLPHSASIPYWIEMIRVYEGNTWYRKSFKVDESLRGKNVYVDFEGAFQHSWVYLNGNLLGEHKGGFTGFCYDMTPHLVYGAENVLSVRVKNGWDATIAPRAGDSIFPNGLNRSVRLVITNDIHVDWFGQFITTPVVSKEVSAVNVKTELVNRTDAPQKVTLMVEVISKDGTVVSEQKKEVEISKHSKTIVSQDLPDIKNPKLWSPDSPYLYKVKTRVIRDGQLIDYIEDRLGIRWFKFTRNKGFWLNGKPFYIWGFNIHEDRAGWAFAGTDAGMYRDIKIMKDVGANIIRASHNPHPRAFYRACDELGLLVFDELHFWGRGGFGKYGPRIGGEDGHYMADAYPPNPEHREAFEATLKANFTNMVRERRNHPSIIAWSLGNETVMQMKGETREKTVELFHELNDMSHRMDPTRPTAVGNAVRYIADVEGFNGGNPKTNLGSRPLLTTEFPLHKPPQKDDWRNGAIGWAAFDYGTHCWDRRTGKTFGPRHGLYDHHRLPKRWGQDLIKEGHPHRTLDPKPGVPAKLLLTTDKEQIRNDGTDDAHLVVSVLDKDGQLIDNDVPFGLRVISGPGLLPTEKVWITSTQNMGRQAIEFRSYESGKAVIAVDAEGLETTEVEINVIDTAASNEISLK
jgi:beta-galactosidase/beta-glucuronidase